MKFKKTDFIDFESKNVLTQKVWLIILMYVCIYLIYNICVYFVYNICILFSYFFIDPTALADSDFLMLFSLYITIIGIILTLIYVRFLEGRPLSSTGINKSGFLKQYGFGYLLGIIMIGLPTIALLLFNSNVYVNVNVNYGLLALYFFGFLIQGASEEIMIRGYLLTSLAKAKNVFWAVVISSLVFALLHSLNPSMGILPFINLFLFGVFASVFFLRTKNIWAICALHSSWNFFQGNVFGIQVSGQVLNNSVLNIKSTCPEILSGGDFGLEGGLLVTALLIAATLITIFYGKNKLASNASEQTEKAV